jgi:hypothetical protein
MRMLPVAVIVGAFAFGNYYVSAQDRPTPKPTYTPEAMLKRIRDANAGFILDAVNCVLQDKTERAVNTTFTELDGRTYRCVVVVDQNFQRRGVAWTPVSPQP